MTTSWALIASLVLLVGNGFFVAAEFALVASKSYRLEQAAAAGSRAARSALDGTKELSVMLAGAQLGITICTLGLGALAEPALAHAIEPALHAVALPSQASHVIAFVIALALVVFLHMVVGEMAPKSWAISDPERAATLLAPTFRAFARLVRPLLTLLNAMANGLLRIVRVQPQDRLAQAHGPEELAMLLEQSREHGTIEATQHQLLDSMLKLRQRTLTHIMRPITELATVGHTASAEYIEQACRATGRSRLGVTDDSNRVVGIVHVRDAIRATTVGPSAAAADLMATPFRLPATASLLDALAMMRDQRSQLAIVDSAAGPVGFLALEDLLEEVIGDFEDETDRTPTVGRSAAASRR